MRILVFYDLPVTTADLRKKYQTFHNYLIRDGYDMLQFSVYHRLCNGYDAVDKFLGRLQANVPSIGHVRAMVVTEKQYAETKFLVGTPTKQEQKLKHNKQLMLF
jgi:CRISPR-associated protein Cas2